MTASPPFPEPTTRDARTPGVADPPSGGAVVASPGAERDARALRADVLFLRAVRGVAGDATARAVFVALLDRCELLPAVRERILRQLRAALGQN
jgi:hypothetical protein